MEEIFRFFYADKRWRSGIVHQNEICQHLQCAIRREAGHDRFFKRRILDLQQQPAIRHLVCNDAVNLGNFLLKPAENQTETVGVLFREVLDDIDKIVSGFA